jgi:hypothetical protein
MQAEKFTIPEMIALRNELMQGALDSRQAAELFQLFLMGRGYGVSPQAAWDAAAKVGGAGCSVESLQQELEKIALVM